MSRSPGGPGMRDWRMVRWCMTASGRWRGRGPVRAMARRAWFKRWCTAMSVVPLGTPRGADCAVPGTP